MFFLSRKIPNGLNKCFKSLSTLVIKVVTPTNIQKFTAEITDPKFIYSHVDSGIKDLMKNTFLQPLLNHDNHDALIKAGRGVMITTSYESESVNYMAKILPSDYPDYWLGMGVSKIIGEVASDISKVGFENTYLGD